MKFIKDHSITAVVYVKMAKAHMNPKIPDIAR